MWPCVPLALPPLPHRFSLHLLVRASDKYRILRSKLKNKIRREKYISHQKYILKKTSAWFASGRPSRLKAKVSSWSCFHHFWHRFGIWLLEVKLITKNFCEFCFRDGFGYEKIINFVLIWFSKQNFNYSDYTHLFL